MILSIENVSKKYAGRHIALDNINLTIEPGMFGLLGPNGAGKSTLMKILATLIRPDEGRIKFGEVDVLKSSMELRKLLGYVPQEFGFYPSLSVKGMLEFLAATRGLPRHLASRRIGELMEAFNLQAVKNVRIHALSRGIRQRIGIAQALLGNPKLLIVDEPTAGLDPEERLRFHNLLAALGQDICIILSTHIVSDISAVCTQMALICQSRIQVCTTPGAALRSLEGSVFEYTVAREHVSDVEQKYRVLTRTMESATSVRLKVFSANGRWEAGFRPTLPSLEDYYFAFVTGVA